MTAAEQSALEKVKKYGNDILLSDGMQKEKQFRQHGTMSVFDHSVSVAMLCVRIASRIPVHIDTRSLVRGALLHDYFLYDWHVPDKSHQLHGFYHAERALKNARRDFNLNDIEQNMIRCHMFPLNLILPRCRESVILCIADKCCALYETLHGITEAWISRLGILQ